MIQQSHTSVIYPREVKMYVHTKIYPRMSTAVHNYPKLVATQITVNKWMVKQMAIYPDDGKLLSHKKQWPIDIFNLDKSRRHSIEWKKLVFNHLDAAWFHLYEVLEKMTL